MLREYANSEKAEERHHPARVTRSWIGPSKSGVGAEGVVAAANTHSKRSEAPVKGAIREVGTY
jgi:hypothetical protein